ncbi:MAG: dTDP-4-dehydrorhamnose 3,5-epimerase [Pelagibacterales bacterium]|nr:dTDP-4-dehydrorhamnose 3,5-epimerase [Pelagibacterales bacterium]
MTFKVKKFVNKPFIDHRGYYWTSWEEKSFKNIKFKHDKFSLSKKNVLRGLHGDDKTWKLVSCPYGEFLLVVVNCIKKSNDYLKSKSWILSHKNGLQILIPPNFANGHLCLSDKCLFHYKLSYKGSYLDANKQFSIRWNDPKLKIKWPIKNPILSLRDRKAKFL